MIKLAGGLCDSIIQVQGKAHADESISYITRYFTDAEQKKTRFGKTIGGLFLTIKQ